MHLQVTITGDKDELAKFRKLGDKLTDFSGAMRTVGSELKSYYGKQVFASEGGVYGDRWAALSPVYREWKGRHYPGKGILVASGRLQSNMRATSTSNSATIDNPTPYFGYLQTGTRRMLSRPMLAVNNDVEDIVKHVIEDDVKRKLAVL